MTFTPGTWEITVLSLLREAPMHPYQMQRLLKLRHKDEILALKRGSLYHAIRRLVQPGLIAVEKTGREGNRPERTTYRITPEGEQAFVEALRRIVSAPVREPSECMIAMSFLVHLDPTEAHELLEKRGAALESEIAGTRAGLARGATFVDRINLIESEYLLAMLRAELAWIRNLEADIREGKLAWNLDTILRGAESDRRAASKRRK
jgi:DNA-binding PadR family transcriptional regulator